MKFESLKSSKFEALSNTAIQHVFGGDGATPTNSTLAGKGWCETKTGAGQRPDGQASWSSDVIYTDGNGNRVGMETTK
ncbi:hypothetical protein [Taibaiella koreensis]|uniref:hypothetical protein n=1 Tax=Taibaiella koreensis TaxID=1268548 RepID=UPI0013C31D64|nr:hypothetical protein [Taibaiella koreensis]